MNEKEPITRLLAWAVFGAALLLPFDPEPAQVAPQESEPPSALPRLTIAYAADPASLDAGLTVAQTAATDASTPDQGVPGPADAPSTDVAGLTPVVVAGSHIRRSEIEGPQHVDIITPDLVERVGGVKLGDYLPYTTTNNFPTDSVSHMWGRLTDVRVDPIRQSSLSVGAWTHATRPRNANLDLAKRYLE